MGEFLKWLQLMQGRIREQNTPLTETERKKLLDELGTEQAQLDSQNNSQINFSPITTASPDKAVQNFLNKRKHDLMKLGITTISMNNGFLTYTLEGNQLLRVDGASTSAKHRDTVFGEVKNDPNSHLGDLLSR